MSKKVTHKINLPERIKNPNYNVTVGNDGVRRSWYREPEFLTIKDKNQDLLKKGFTKIENLAYSDHQLRSINDFFMDNYRRLCKLRLFEGFQYSQWKVFKRHDDILFNIHDVWGADMTIDDQKFLFPFLGGVVDVSEQIKFHPESFDFEYQFHLYNETSEE